MNPAPSARGNCLLIRRLNADLGNAAGIHLNHGQTAIFEDDRFARLRNMPQPIEQKSGEGFDAAIARQIPRRG